VKKLLSFLAAHFKERITGNTVFGHGELKAMVDANKSLALFTRFLFAVVDRGQGETWFEIC
jgi:hypothetical protein